MNKKNVISENRVTSATNETLFCTWCRKDVSFHMEKVDHRRELILTICSAGLWLPFWLLLMAAAKTNRICDDCGSAISRESKI